jgi:hypothetical protein
VVWGAVSLLALATVLFLTALYLIGPENPQNGASMSQALTGIFHKKESSLPSAPILPAPPVPAIPATAAISPLPEQPEKNIAPEKTPEPLLGAISIKHRLTLWRILDDIYGDNGVEARRQIILANPQIKDSGKIAESAVIQVPLIMDRGRPIPPGTILVSLQSGNDLEPLYYSFIERKDQPGMPGLLFLSFWNKREGKKFVVVLNKRFTSTQAAQEAISRLPLEFAASAKILSEWDGDTVCFNRKLAGI